MTKKYNWNRELIEKDLIEYYNNKGINYCPTCGPDPLQFHLRLRYRDDWMCPNRYIHDSIIGSWIDEQVDEAIKKMKQQLEKDG